MTSRRDFLKGATAAGIGAASGLSMPGLSFAATKVRLQLSWFVTAAAAGEVVAQKKGFFADKGLEVEIAPGGPNVNSVQDVVGGQSEISVAYAPQIMAAANNRLPIKCFAASYQKAPLTFFSLGEANIESVADWKGKRIGASQSAVPQIKALLAASGLEFEDITMVQAQVPALLQDQVDVVAAWPTNVGQIKAVVDHPSGYNAQSIWDNGLQFQSNYYIATQDTLESGRDMLVGFLEACDAGWVYAADNAEEATDMLLAVAPALDRELTLQSLQLAVRDYIFTEETQAHGFGNVSAERWDQTLSTYKALGEIRQDVQVADLFDPSILENSNRTKR